MFSGTAVDCEGEPESRDLTNHPPNITSTGFKFTSRVLEKVTKLDFTP